MSRIINTLAIAAAILAAMLFTPCATMAQETLSEASVTGVTSDSASNAENNINIDINSSPSLVQGDTNIDARTAVDARTNVGDTNVDTNQVVDARDLSTTNVDARTSVDARDLSTTNQEQGQSLIDNSVMETLRGADLSTNIDFGESYTYNWATPQLLNTNYENLAFKQGLTFGNVPATLQDNVRNNWFSRATLQATLEVMNRQHNGEEAIAFMGNPERMVVKYTAKAIMDPVFSNQSVSLKEIGEMEKSGAQFVYMGSVEMNPVRWEKKFLGGLKPVNETLYPTKIQMREIAAGLIRSNGGEFFVELPLDFVSEFFEAVDNGFSISGLFNKITEAGRYASHLSPEAGMKAGSNSHTGHTRYGSAFVYFTVDFVEPQPEKEYETIRPFISDELAKAYEAIAHCPDANIGNAKKRFNLLSVLKERFEQTEKLQEQYTLIVLMRDASKQGTDDLRGLNSPEANRLRGKLNSFRGLTWAWNADLVGRDTPEGRSCLEKARKYWSLD